MAIIFPVNTVGESLSKLNLKGAVLQSVINQSTVSTTVTTSAWVTVFTTNITLSNPSNQVLVEYMMNDRSDQGNGNWCLIYHRIWRNGAQVLFSGYNGAQANHITYYSKSFLDSPGGGAISYVASVLSYSGTAWIGNYNSGSTNHYLNLFEIGAT